MLDFKAKRILLSVKGMDQVTVRRDITYKTTGNLSLQMDLYLPPGTPAGYQLPAVLLVHGDAPWEILGDAKDWGQYRSWGEVLAASGLAAVTFTHRSTERMTRVAEAMSDVTDLIAFVREHAGHLQINPDRVGLWVCSMGGPVGLTPVLKEVPEYIRCVAALYPLMDYSPQMLPPGVDAEPLRSFSPLVAMQETTSKLPPMLLVRAGQDHPELNAGIGRFLSAAMQQNCDLELINYAGGHHAFDLRNDDERSREVLRRVVSFLGDHLHR